MAEPAEVIGMQPATEEDADKLRAWLNDLIKNRGVTVTTIAREMGVSHSLISQFLSGTKKSNNLIAKLQQFRTRVEQAAGNEAQERAAEDTTILPHPAFPAGLFMTEDLRQVLGLCAMCQEDGEIGVVIGPAGSGKTTALQEFCRREQRTAYIKADVTMSPKELLFEIGQKLGVSLSGSRRAMARQIVNQLRLDPVLIIVDEADVLVSRDSVLKLDVLRGIWDEAHSGLVLAGPPVLAKYLVKGPGGQSNLAQFYSRVRRAYYMKGVTRDEAMQILSGYRMTEEARNYLVAAAVSKAHGGLRRFTRLLQNALDLCEPGETITTEIVREADGMLVSPKTLGLEF